MTKRSIKTAIVGSVGILTLHRPEAMNALSEAMMHEVHDVITAWDADPAIRAIVITGSDKAFAGGADIKEMVDLEYLDTLDGGFIAKWSCISNCRTPTIAAVAGYALGGGCEVAMMCDFIIAADNAQFAQPEILIGTIPGLGGTQRLTRLVGKSKAMDLCLTGRMMDAEEAERSGLVSRLVPLESLLDEAMQAAVQISEKSSSVVSLAKSSVNAALNSTLDEGLRQERQAFLSLFGTDDQKEGMRAFIDKRAPDFGR